jgi:glycine oxidase
VFVATGHFKGGLHLSTATAIVLADLAEGKKPTIDLRPFSPARVTCHHSAEIK